MKIILQGQPHPIIASPEKPCCMEKGKTSSSRAVERQRNQRGDPVEQLSYKYKKPGLPRRSAPRNDRVGIFFIAIITFFLLHICPSFAAQKDLSRYASYLNGIKTLEAVFFERNSLGGTSSGKVYVYRPSAGSSEKFGKLRLTYDLPRQIEILADGSNLLHYDKKDDDINSLSLESTPVAFLLRPIISFSNEVTVHHIQTENQMTRITIYQTDEPDAGMLTLIFTESPLELKQWMVTDAQGVKTLVTLDHVKKNTPLHPSVFQLKKR